MHGREKDKDKGPRIKEELNNMNLADESISDESISKKDTWNNKLIQILIIVVLVGVIVLSVFINNEWNNNDNEPLVQSVSLTKTIRINEYMIRNQNTLRDEDWDSPDWVEIYNYGKKTVFLGDVYLSDSVNNPEKFKLPDIELQPDSYMLVLASGKEYKNSTYIHAPFKLSNTDIDLILFYNQKVINKVCIENLPMDISQGHDSHNKLGYFAEPTPGYANDSEVFYELYIEGLNSKTGLLRINEYVIKNNYGITNINGEHLDWIEIYNPNDYEVFMADFYLSDDETSLNKYKLPDGYLAPHGYIIIYASGIEETTDDSYTAPFGISADDRKLVLSYKNGQQVDIIEVFDLKPDISAGLDADGNVRFFAMATPNGENITESSADMDIMPIFTADSPLVINEWMSNNEFNIIDSDGDASDWVEIYNPSDEKISLTGYSMTDDILEPKKWIFPNDAYIDPKSYVLVYMSSKDKVIGDEIHANFKLGSDETIYLNTPNAGVIDNVNMEYLPGNVSKGRTANGYGYFSYPTPKSANTSSYVPTIQAGMTFLINELYISEVAPGKVSAPRYWGEYTFEYIELYNNSNTVIDLEGYSIVEDEGKPFTFSSVSINPNEYLVVSVKGYIKRESGYIAGENLSLSSTGERLFLKDNTGVIIDCFDTGYVINNYSSGRLNDNTGARVFFIEKTPGQPNGPESYTSYSVKPIFSHTGGMVANEFDLTIIADNDVVLYFTIDGSLPSPHNEKSLIYSQPIRISKDTIVRAVSISNGKLPSLPASSTYIFARSHNLPILCLSTDPDGFFSSAKGIYADGYGHYKGISPYWSSNYYWNVERPVSLEYYNTDGTIGIAFDGAVAIAGAYSRAYPQKSLVIRLRDEYGVKQVDFPFFENGHTTFSHLLLRNSGQDNSITKMRDPFILNCAEELGTVDTKRGTPVAVYINGEYWGLYNMRDKLNADHMRHKYGLDDDVVINYLTFAGSAKSGNNEDWFDLKKFCSSLDFNVQENYDKLAERIDIDIFIDYWVVQMYFAKRDTHNIDYWKPEIDGAKWRPILFDTDVALLPNDVNVVAELLGSSKLNSDHIKKALFSSDIFKEQFLNRFSYILDNIYTEEYLKTKLHAYKNEMTHEMEYHIERWPYPSTIERWEYSYGILETELLGRRNDVVEELQEYFKLTDDEVKELFPWYS